MALSQKELAHLEAVGNYSSSFDELRQNRCAMSLYKYGPAKKNFPDRVQAIPTMEKCIEKIQRNEEYRVFA